MLEDSARLTRFCEGFDQVEDFPTARPGTLLLFYFGRKLQFRSDPGDIKVRGRGILRDINDTGETCTVKGQETLMFFFLVASYLSKKSHISLV